MRLQQATTFRPFMRQSVVPALIAGMAGYHEIIRPIASTTRKRNNMVNMNLPFTFGQLVITPIASSLLSLILSLDILPCMISRGLQFASATIAHFYSSVRYTVLQLPVHLPISAPMLPSCTIPCSPIISSFFTMCSLILLLPTKDSLSPSAVHHVIASPLFCIATYFACGLQPIRGRFGREEVFPRSRFLFVALDTYKRLRWCFLRLLLYPGMFIFLVACLAKRIQPIGTAFVGIEEFCSGCKDPLTMGTLFISIGSRRRVYSRISGFLSLSQTCLTKRLSLCAACTRKFCLRLLLVAFGTTFRYNVTHGKNLQFLSSRPGVLAHRLGNNISEIIIPQICPTG